MLRTLSRAAPATGRTFIKGFVAPLLRGPNLHNAPASLSTSSPRQKPARIGETCTTLPAAGGGRLTTSRGRAEILASPQPFWGSCLSRRLTGESFESEFLGPALAAGAAGNASDLKMQVAVVNEGEKQHLCQYEKCGKGFPSASGLTRHVAQKHGPKIHVCKDCDATYGLLKDFNQHVARKHGPKTHVCPAADCPEAFGTLSELNRHVAQKHGPKTHVCPAADCPEAFGTLSELNRHVAQKHGPKTHVCPAADCPEAFGTLSELNRHVAQKHGPKTHVCPAADCPEAFGTLGELNRHVARKHGPKTHACVFETCDAAFGTVGALNGHVKQVHNKTHVCPVADCLAAPFGTVTDLHRHIEVVHEGKKPHVCPCGHPFADIYKPKRHLPTCGRITNSQRAAISSNGCSAFRARVIGEADRYAEQLVASAVGGQVPVLHRDSSTDEQDDWLALVHTKVLLVAAAIGDGPHALYIGSTNAKGLDPETRFLPADDPRLVKCLTRRGSHASPHYTSRNEDEEWVFAARQYPPPGEGFPVPAMIPIAVSFDPTVKTTVVEGRLVRLGHAGKGPLFLNPPKFNGGDGLKMEKHGSVLYLLPTTGKVGRDEVGESLDKLRAASKEKRAETKRKQKQSSEDELSLSSSLAEDILRSSLEGDSLPSS